MGKTLDEQIKERIELAKEKRIEEKAGVVARVFGTTETSYEEGESTTSRYEEGTLKIETNSGYMRGSDGSLGFYGTNIKHEAREVFRFGGGTMYVYIPGPETWEKTLDRKYQEAQQRLEIEGVDAQKLREAKQEAEDKKIRANWGL